MKWVAALVAVLMLTACTTRVGGKPDQDGGQPTEPPKVGAVDLRVPLDLYRVLESMPSSPGPVTTPAGARVLDDADGLSYTLENPPFLTLDRIEAGSVEEQNGSWVIRLSLTKADGGVFGDWTGDHIGEQAAIVADDTVIVAPEILEAIPGNEVQIATQYTREEAEDFLHEITGR